MKDINNIFVKKDTTIKEAMRTIDRSGVRTVLVVEGPQSRFCGIITDGDIQRAILKGIDIQSKISGIMTANPVFASVSTSEEDIVKIMKTRDITSLPLLDKKNTVRDFVFLPKNGNLLYFKNDSRPKEHLKKILVIGGAGYIGSVLVRKLLLKNYKVNVLDKFIYYRYSLDEIEKNPNFKIIEGDTRHIEDITSAIQGMDAVVHLAELVGDPAAALNSLKTQEINYLATKTISTICKHFQINKLIYASSCSVYGASSGDELLSERSSLCPVSLYAKMKIASEDALREMQDDNFRPTILRFATVFGISHRPRFDLIVNLLSAKAIREKKITIFGGNQWRPNVHVADVADAIISVLESPIDVVGGEIFNVGSEENNFTINQIGELVKQIVPSAELIIEDKKNDERNYRVDFNKLKNTLNIHLERSLLDGISEIKNHLEKNQDMDYRDKKYSNIKFLEESNAGL